MSRRPSGPGAFHESLARDEAVRPGSDRAFGLVMAAVLAVVAAWPLATGGSLRRWALVAAVLLVAVSLARPRWLGPAHRAWLAAGGVLHRVTTPLVLGLVFYGVVVPTGLVMRRFRRDPLGLAFEPARDSYWLPRRPPGPAPGTMRRQF